MDDKRYIIIVLVVLLVVFLRDRKRNSSDDRQLIGHDKINAMLDYLRMRTPCSRRDYQLPLDVYNELAKSGLSQTAVRKVVICVLNYLRIDYTNVNIDVEYLDSSNGNKSGYYESYGSNSKITIKIRPNYSEEQVIAIVCHECCHHFMHLKELGAKKDKDNEYLTDITAIYLGFGEYIKEGYSVISKEEMIGNAIRCSMYHVGYLNIADIKYTIKCVNDIRKKAISLEKNKV